MKSGLRDILWTVVFAALAFLLLRVSIQTFRVKMTSMMPTIRPGLWVVVDKISYRFHQPQNGDVIIFEAPIDPESDFIKRVIAIPGDTVEVRTGKVYVNGAAVTEPYISRPPRYVVPPRLIPPDEFFVLGDNRDGGSKDSSEGWLVPRQNIVGRAWIVIWPPTNWGLAPNYALSTTQPRSALAGALTLDREGVPVAP